MYGGLRKRGVSNSLKKVRALIWNLKRAGWFEYPSAARDDFRTRNALSRDDAAVLQATGVARLLKTTKNKIDFYRLELRDDVGDIDQAVQVAETLLGLDVTIEGWKPSEMAFTRRAEER